MKPSTLEYWKPSNLWERLTNALARVLLIRREDAASYRGRLIHGVWLISMAGMLTAGVVLLIFSPTNRPTATGAMGGLALTATLGMFLVERLTSLLYNYPLRRQQMVKSFLMRHPLVALLFTAALHMVAALSTDALLLFHSPTISGWYKGAGMLLLGLAALPFWTILLHIRQTFQQARKLRQANKTSPKQESHPDDGSSGWRERFQQWRQQARELKNFLQELGRQD